MDRTKLLIRSTSIGVVLVLLAWLAVRWSIAAPFHHHRTAATMPHMHPLTKARSEAAPQTFREALDWYGQLVTPTKRGWREEEVVIRVVRRHGEWLLDMPLDTIEPHHVATYRDTRLVSVSFRTLRNGAREKYKAPPSRTTVRKELTLISSVFRKCVEWGCNIRNNPVIPGMRPPPNPLQIRRVNPEQIEVLLQHARVYEDGQGTHVPISSIIEFALHSAMRLGELATMRWENIDLSRKMVRLPITKNGSPRTVPLTPNGVALLRQQGERIAGSVWHSDKTGISTAWNRVVRRSGLQGIRFHDLRHEAVSHFVENADLYGLSVPELMFISGHKSMSHFTRYFHAIAPRIADKLDRGSELVHQRRATESGIRALSTSTVC